MGTWEKHPHFPCQPPETIWKTLPPSLLYLWVPQVSARLCREVSEVPERKGTGQAPRTANPRGVPEGQPQPLPPSPAGVLLALRLAGGLVERIPQDGVLLLQAGELRVGAVLQLLLQGPNLGEGSRGYATWRGAGDIPAQPAGHRGTCPQEFRPLPQSTDTDGPQEHDAS